MLSMTNVQLDQIPTIIQEAKEAAFTAADKFFKEELNGQDQYACGFACTYIAYM